MFRHAEYVPVILEPNHLMMNGHQFNRVEGIPIPERFDVLPGTGSDENGISFPQTFRSELQDYLSEPPREVI